MVDDQDYEAINEDEASRLLKKILSPAEAQSLVPPPPTHAPSSGPGESTPLTGSLAKPPSQATPSRATANEDVQAIQPSRHLHAEGCRDTSSAASARSQETPDRSSDPQYVKVSSNGQVGYLPKANLRLARKIDSNLKVLSED